MDLLLFLLFGGILSANVGTDKSETKKAIREASQRLSWHVEQFRYKNRSLVWLPVTNYDDNLKCV